MNNLRNLRFNPATKSLSFAVFWLLCISVSPVSAATSGNATVDCPFNLEWMSKPELPQKVVLPNSGTPAKDNCRFQQFMWQSFSYLVSPSAENKNIPNFQNWMPSYGIFVGAKQKPAPWGTTVTPEYCEAKAKDGFVYSDFTLQAGSEQPLIDQQNQFVYYGVSVNQSAYDFITQCDLYRSQCALTLAPDLLNEGKIVNIPLLYPNLAFPVGAVELKTSWKILTQSEIKGGTFFVRQGYVRPPNTSKSTSQCQSHQLGLVGMHIVSKTPNHPEFIWGTFEHRNNVPDCTNLDAKPKHGEWTFISKECATTDNNCNLNNYRGKKSPSEICREHPWGDPVQGIFPNNLNCNSSPQPNYICKENVQKNVIAPSTATLIAINQSADQVLRGTKQFSLWANYELTGNIWTVAGLPPNLQIQAGSLSSANTSMETYVQNGEAGVTNPNSCFSCHNLSGKTQNNTPVTLPPAGISHIFNLMQTDTGGCESGELPKACSIYFNH